MWSGKYSLDQLFLSEVFLQSVIYCFVLSHVMAHPGRRITVALSFFYRELRMLLKLESWDSYKGTIRYCPVRAQYRMFFRTSSTSFWKHLSSFPGKESLPDVSTLPCYFVCQSEPDQKVTGTERGKLYFPIYLLHSAAFTACGSHQVLW